MSNEEDARLDGARVALAQLVNMALRDLGDTDLRTVLCAEKAGEARIEMWLGGVMQMGLAPFVLPDLPHSDADKWRFQPALPWKGACDLMIYHADGTVSAVELKDGAQGLRACQAGIGQVTCAAVHLNPCVRVRRVLAWTPMSKLGDNRTLFEACKASGVVPIVLPSDDQRTRFHKVVVTSVLEDVTKGMREARHGSAQ